MTNLQLDQLMEHLCYINATMQTMQETITHNQNEVIKRLDIIEETSISNNSRQLLKQEEAAEYLGIAYGTLTN